MTNARVEADLDDPAWSSHSAILKHRACPQAWNYAYLQGLQRDEEEVAKPWLEFGNWWHALRAASSVERGRALGTLKYAPKDLSTADGFDRIAVPDETPPGEFIAHVLSECDRYWGTLSEDAKELWRETLGQDLPTRLRAVWRGWSNRYADEIDSEEPIAVEVKWVRAMPSGKTLVGYIDEIYRDRKRNLVVVRDHKAHKTLANQTAADDMMDSQLQLYAWGVAPKAAEWGVKIMALSYDRVRSLAPKQPKLTASGGLSASVKDFDLDTYLEWVGDGIPWGEPGAYFTSGRRKGEPKFGVYTAEESVIERLSSPAAQTAWFQRTLTPLNLNLIKAHLQAAVDTTEEMSRTVERINATGAAPRNLSKDNCRWCDFSKLCRAQMVGGPDGDYTLEELGLKKRPPRSKKYRK